MIQQDEKKMRGCVFKIHSQILYNWCHYSLENLFAVCVTLAYHLIFAKYCRILELTTLISNDCAFKKGLFEFNNISLNMDIGSGI